MTKAHVCRIGVFAFSLLGGSIHTLRAQTLSVTPKLIPFPNQGTQTTSVPATVTLSNANNVPISIAGIQTSAPFAQTNNCGSTLAAGKACTLNITFSPTAVQYYSSTVTISDSASNAPQVISVNGNGVVPVSYTPKAGGYYFVHQIAGTSSTPQIVTITNNQSSPLAFNSIQSSAAFPFTTNCGDGKGGGTLAGQSSCTIQVSFDPPAVASYTANLTISENAPGSPVVIPLQGTGVAGTQGPTVTVKPTTPCALPLETQQFTANVVGISNPAVSWYVDGVLNGNSAVGTISPAGLYTAPAASAGHTIKAVSQASSSVSGSTVITISTAPTFEIYPYVSSIPAGGQQSFQAQVCFNPDPGSVTYSVDNIVGGNSTVGTVTPVGVYTAPATPGKHTVRVTDAALNKTTGAVVTVFSSITADFGSRAGNTPPIPANLFGYGRGESLHNASDAELLTQGGLTVSRMSAQISMIYATQTPNWAKIDPFVSAAQAAGQHVILQLNQSPPWLQPTTGSCAANTYAAPTSIAQWTQIATAIVAHLDSTFPGVVQDYEIWNEPNSTGMCTTANHMTTYMAIYAAAAPAMKAQAASDGQTIRIGGPVLSGYSQIWLSTLLTTPTTAPYVDFVSYHQYFFGSTQLQAQWDTWTGDMSLYEATQDPSNGAAAVYSKVLGQVALGAQPLGAQTPVYVTEFNTNWAFFQDCCRNDPSYAPVFNALYVTDLLDSVYNGNAQVPNKLVYFAGNAYPWFCLIGVDDANSDCLYSTGASPVPYPQYYPFQLFGSPNYLGLSGGGNMAKSISTPTGGGGLATTAFYTPAQDAIVIINPTSTSYAKIQATFANPGLSATQATLYTIANGTQINASAVALTASGTSLSTFISVPPYSVQAISLK